MPVGELVWTARPLLNGPGPWTDPFDDEPLIRVEEVLEEGAWVIRAELPGVDPEKDIELVVANGVMTLRAERHEGWGTKDRLRRSEFRYGHFERTVTLPAGANEQDVKATYENGILEVRIPIDGKTAEARRVPITRP